METVRYTDEGGRYRTGGVTFEPGDVGEVSAGLAEHLVADVGSFEYVDEETLETADTEDEDETEGEDEGEEAPNGSETKNSVVTAPDEFTIDEIEAELETGEWDDHLETLRENEEAGKDRAGVHDAIGVRRAEIEG
ncbi:hypothetical protein HYG81_15185 [Natrinema zhouii]|uniref:Uncharacterized protein n=1 Tax=Natrinema zhouii TaxID=1710539 RepID=A0A7D6CMY5_9EURY|nr:hypothetical protein [Natrinema zhouii]QLK25417.1 hypothetical protein HYG81_15185 [Natrinema zhouii]